MKRSALNRNHYFVFGFLLGLILSFYIPEDIWELVQNECPQTAESNSFDKKFGQDFEPHLNLVNKPLAAKKPNSITTTTVWRVGGLAIRTLLSNEQTHLEVIAGLSFSLFALCYLPGATVLLSNLLEVRAIKNLNTSIDQDIQSNSSSGHHNRKPLSGLDVCMDTSKNNLLIYPKPIEGGAQ